MNKRILELAKQARLIQYDSDGKLEEVQRFAELIVAECAELARQHNLEKADRSHLIHKAVKKHFGVE